MTTEPTEEQLAAIEAFRAVARRYCAEIEAAPESTDIALLRKLNITLPELYLRLVQLPDLDPWEEFPEDDEELEAELARRNISSPVYDPTEEMKNEVTSRDWYWSTYGQLQQLLEGHDWHHYVWEPFRGSQPTPTRLSLQLAEVYEEIKKGLYYDDAMPRSGESLASRMWRWDVAFGVLIFVLIEAISATAWLVLWHWDDYEDIWFPLDPTDPTNPAT